MTNARVRAGVAGAGYWGDNLVRNAHELGILTAVCDPTPSIVARVRERYPHIAVFGDFEELLRAPIDAVIIAAPAHLHAPLALRAIAAGKHVFIEKPLALSVEDGEAIEHTAQRAGVVAFVGHLLLYHPALRRLLELVESGRIGDVWHVRSRRLNLGKLRAHESVWWSFAPHDIAVMLEILKSTPTAVRASYSGHLNDAICDAAYADFSFASGTSAHIEVGWLDPGKNQRLDVFGTEGVITFEDARSGAALRLTPCGARRNAEETLELWREDAVDVPFEHGEPLRLELEAFCDAVVTGREPLTGAREGVEVLRALTMADESALNSHFRPEVFAQHA